MVREVKTSESRPIEVFWVDAAPHVTPGRMGRIASIVLTTFGHTADDAIAIVRRAQPGAVETSKQREYVRTARRRLAAKSGIAPPAEGRTR